jgi:hypothetical protein
MAAALFAAIASGSVWRWADSSEADIRQAADDHAAHYSDPANIPVEGRCLSLSPPDQFQCITPEREAARDGQRNERDLEAQQVMATWTKAMGLAAIIGMSVGVFGLGLIFVTFRETKRTADEARRGADQAEKARQAYFDRERGHLRIKQILGELQDDEILRLWFSVENHGASVLEVDAINIVFADDPIWPDILDGLGEGLQIKLAAGDSGGVKFKTTSAVGFPCFIFGYIRYRSLSVGGLKSYFSAKMIYQSHDIYGHMVESKEIPDFSLPHDT